MNELSFENAVQNIVTKKCSSYTIDAYYFVKDALDIATPVGTANKHVTGQKLCEVIKDHAIASYSIFAQRVLSSWGINKTDDIGEIVYLLINEGVFGKNKNDKKEDFNDVFDMSTVKEMIDVDEELFEKAKINAFNTII